MGNAVKVALVVGIILVVAGFLLGLIEAQRSFNERSSALEERFTAYELRREQLTQQQLSLEAAQQDLALRIDRAIEQQRQLAAQRSAQEQNAAAERAARIEQQRLEQLRLQQLEQQRQQELLAKQQAQRTTRAS